MKNLGKLKMLAIAHITADGQTTLPHSVRAVLQVNAGDVIAWDMNADGQMTVRRLPPLDEAYFHALEDTLSEWSSSADEEAYRDL